MTADVPMAGIAMIEATSEGVAGAPPEPGLAVECISLVHLYHLPDNDVVALRGVDLDIDAGEIVALLGPSGMGKSTLLKILAGILRQSAGRALVGGRDVGRMSPADLRKYRAVDVGIVMQDPLANLLPYATVAENVEFARSGAEAYGSRPQMAVTDLLELLGLGGSADRPVSVLSGGEQQVVAIAAGASGGGRLLLVDEPTSQLDVAGRDRVTRALHELHEETMATIVLVTHDPDLAASIARTVTIRDGRVGAEGRHGSQYAVVARDGTIQLPPEILDVLPPDTLVRLVRHADGVDLRNADLEQLMGAEEEDR